VDQVYYKLGKIRTLCAIAQSQLKAKDMAGAEKSLAVAETIMKTMDDKTWHGERDREEAIEKIIDVKLMTGDLKAAEAYVSLISDESRYRKKSIYESIAAEAIKQAKLDVAKSAADRISKDTQLKSERLSIYLDIASKMGQQGDLSQILAFIAAVKDKDDAELCNLLHAAAIELCSPP
jgi:hypothetical protein